MIRKSLTSLTVLGTFGLLALAAQGCSVETIDNGIQIKTVPEFTDSNEPAKTSTKAWAGEAIEINNGGVNPLTGTGGVQVTVDSSATNITVSAVFAARADVEAEAKQSIEDAKATLQIAETDGKFSISCGHGGAHGSSKVAASGCKLLKVTIPAGSASQPLDLKVGSGNGDLTFNGTPVVSNLVVDSNGQGDVKVSAEPVQGARIVVTGENVVVVSLPSDFAADQVVLNAEGASTAEELAARIITTDFPGMESGKGFGTAGAGASELNVQTKGLLDDYTVTIKKQ